MSNILLGDEKCLFLVRERLGKRTVQKNLIRSVVGKMNKVRASIQVSDREN